jgi:hypothetical protein
MLKGFETASEKVHSANKILCLRAKTDLIDIDSSEDFMKPLIKFFKLREKKR